MMDNGPILVTGAAGKTRGSWANCDRPAPQARASGSRHGPSRGRPGGSVADRRSRGGGRRPARTGRCLSDRQRVSASLLRNVRECPLPRGNRDHGDRRPGSRVGRPGQHVPNDRLPDEYPEHHPSPQQRQHWLSEQALAWSGLPVVTIRPTVFLEGFFLPVTGPTVRDRSRIELPFGRGKTSPVATTDVAQVVAAVLADPGPYIGQVLELTGPRSQDVDAIAREYSEALNREVTYLDIPARGLGTRSEEGGIAGAPDPPSGDDGRAEPRGSV